MKNLSRVFPVLSSPQITLAARSNLSISRPFHSSSLKSAVAHPVTAHGPPPKAPVPSPEFGDRVERRRKQAELIEQAKEVRQQPSKPASPLKKRFWKDVNVRKTEEGYQVLLDTRPVRTPAKTILTIPPSKPHLVHAIALEWDLLTSAQQALKQHLIPLTSTTARADDIIREETQGQTTTRDEILKTVMSYLDTDTILCWVPENNVRDEPVEQEGERLETLREKQMRVAQDIIGFLSTKLWLGIDIKPILDTDSIMPISQPQATKEVIRAWIASLPAYDLAALERGVLAGKSLLVAVRLLVEWSENFRHLQRPGQRKFGIEEAAEASSLEVRWQTDMWGEVEDTHDVEKEDLKRQFGSVVLLVTGEGR